jgi:hypothetical protein
MQTSSIKKIIILTVLCVTMCSSTVFAQTRSFSFELKRGNYDVALTQQRATKADSEQTAYVTATSVSTNNPMKNTTQGVFVYVKRYTTGNQVTTDITIQKKGRYTANYYRTGKAGKKYVLCGTYDDSQAGSYCNIAGRWTP